MGDVIHFKPGADKAIDDVFENRVEDLAVAVDKKGNLAFTFQALSRESLLEILQEVKTAIEEMEDAEFTNAPH